MNIIETAGSQPVTIKPYRTSQKDRQTIADILSEWKHHGIISESTSPYASPVLLVNKSSGEKRLCVDYRKLNRQTVTDPFPMPDIDSQLSTLADGNIFTTLDLSNGFLQIPLSSEAKEKTVFVTEDTTAKFERMPFGLKGAPGTFQRLMSILFKDLRKAGRVSTYLDDIIIPSLNWDDMLVSLRQVFEVLRNSKLTLKPAKCVFGASQLDYLGFQISKGVIRPGKKVDAIHLFPRPRDAHETRFLGLARYFRRFIVNYALISSPLTKLTSKNTPFIWQTEQQTSFDILKTKLCAEPIVRMYNPKALITQVHTDASSVALSGILMQGDSIPDLYMVYAVSKKTTKLESKYHSSRLELYVIIWTLNRLRPYLLGIKFTVVTDCQALVYLNMHKTVKPQIARWFDFEIKYRPGSRMAHVDALGRVTVPDENVQSVDAELAQRLEVVVALSAADRTRFMQLADDHTKNIIRLLQTEEELTKLEMNMIRGFELYDGILYR